jgi:excisionase family DNA binding protein
LPEPNPPLLVDAHEAARLLSISERTLWKLTKDGEIQCKRIGRRVLYSRASLEEFASR